MEKIVTHFMRTGVQPEQIGIITPYEGQRAHVLTAMQRSGALAPALYAEVRCPRLLPSCQCRLKQITRPLSDRSPLLVRLV